MIKGLLLPNYEDWARNSISCKPVSRSFIRKLTFQNRVQLGIALEMEIEFFCISLRYHHATNDVHRK